MTIRHFAALGIGLWAASLPIHAQAPLKDAKDKVSYSIGVNIGSGMKRQGLEINPDILLQGIKDAFAGGKLQLTPAEMQQTLTTYQQELGAKQAAMAKVAGEKNEKEGTEFLKANLAKEGVKATASGLQYKVLTTGKGKKPTSQDTVRVHYKGTLINGTEFDSSYSRGEPAEFPVGGVIAGWTEALQLMTVGSKWQLAIPSALAYGESGQGREIGPNSTLLFDVELLDIVADPDAAKK